MIASTVVCTVILSHRSSSCAALIPSNFTKQYCASQEAIQLVSESAESYFRRSRFNISWARDCLKPDYGSFMQCKNVTPSLEVLTESTP